MLVRLTYFQAPKISGYHFPGGVRCKITTHIFQCAQKACQINKMHACMSLCTDTSYLHRTPWKKCFGFLWMLAANSIRMSLNNVASRSRRATTMNTMRRCGGTPTPLDDTRKTCDVHWLTDWLFGWLTGFWAKQSSYIEKHTCLNRRRGTQRPFFPGMGAGPGFSFRWRPLAISPRWILVGSADLILDFYNVSG